MPIVADAAVKVGADMSSFAREVKTGGEQATRTLGQQIKGVFSPRNLAVAGVAGGVAIASAITAGLADAVSALIDIERLNAQTDAVLKSTGGAANVTRGQIEEAAEAAERATTIEREAVQGAQNLLLTFTKVRNEAGEGNDIFNQATEAILDMSVAMGTDANSAAMQLGKALNDPIKGMAQLGRAGVQFTEEQKALVAQLVETGDILGAQKVILAELETQFGGSAEAFANTTAGKIQRFQNDVGNMFESIILGAVEVADTLGPVVEEIGGFIEGVAGFAGAVGGVGAAVGDAANEFLGFEKKLQPMTNAQWDAVEESGLAWEAYQNQIRATVDESTAIVSDGMDAMADEAGELPDKMADELLASQFELTDATAELVNFMEQAITPAQEMMQIQGFLASNELAQGLSSNNPLIAQKSQEMRDAALSRLAELQGQAWTYGNNVGTSFAAGMNAAYGWVQTAAGNLAAATRNQIGINSEPEGHDSPLRGITKWGGNIVRTIADGIYGELGTGSAAANALAGALVPDLGTPSLLGGATAGAGDTRVYQLYVDGKEKVVGQATDVLNAWEQMEGF